MIARVFSAALLGVEATLVRVEVDVAAGLPMFTTVGLPDSAVRESRERVRTAIRNAGYAFPQDRITVNLAPADVRKEGAAFDLPIALGILVATGTLAEAAVESVAVVGELALDGDIRPVRGTLAVGSTCRRRGIRTLLVPADNRAEATAVRHLRVLPARTLREAVGLLSGENLPEPPSSGDELPPPEPPGEDFGDVAGQTHAKRALEIAAAGNHNALLIGPPGVGKTMLARRLPTILPPLSHDEALEVSTIWSVAGLLPRSGGLLEHRPFRAPHHTTSLPGLIGGGTPPHPGEMTLAHLGVLFLDELPEFQRHVLESLRQPLEDGRVTIARVQGVARFPARFQLVAAANPCRRGCPSVERCLCTPGERERYLGRLSRPLLDRIDLHVELPAVSPAELHGRRGEASASIRERVMAARERQHHRFAHARFRLNADVPPRLLRRYCVPSEEARRLLMAATEQLGLSARAHDRILRVARTIADLAGSPAIEAEHCAEAIQHRILDRTRLG